MSDVNVLITREITKDNTEIRIDIKERGGR